MTNKSPARAVFVVLLFSLFAMTFFDQFAFHVKGMRFVSDLKIAAHGVTELVIPPLGKLSAHTHKMPLKIVFTLQNLDIEALREVINQNPTSAEIIAETRLELARLLYVYLAHLLLLAAAGGLLGALIIYGRRPRVLFFGALGGLFFGTLILGLTYATYDLERLRTPEYHGVLKAAPWALGLAENAFQKVHLLSEQMNLIARNLYTVFEKLGTISALEGGLEDLLVLHVSDIHNNPAALSFLLQITRSFPIDFVIDTGDITDFGTPLEAKLLAGLIDLKVPYLFVPGNHDSPEIMQALSRYPEVQVLTGGIVDIQGLRILALADPAAFTNQITVTDTDIIRKTKDKMIQLWEEADPKPHIVAVHNINLVENLVKNAPLILYGHNHQLTIRKEEGTVLAGAGTTGGAGIRGLQATKEIPYSVILFHFTRGADNEWFLTASDAIKLFNLESGFVLERKVYPKPK